ncbi:MAG: class I SAM-dependent RNA methyltransferase [Chloroflexi bacterium]|nr:class I SAM-dependent RNA methyltransferase [Chloroflexota bacterium]
MSKRPRRQNRPPREVELLLEGIAHGGEAFGRHEGKIIFVPYAIPGERVRVQIVREKARWARARLIDVLTPSPDRITPPCPYFGPDKCGGCQWQHIAYPRQLALKREVVVDQLRRLGHVADPPVREVLAVGEPFHYRNHMQFTVAPDGRLGLFRGGSDQVIPVDTCLLMHPLLEEVYTSLEVGWEGLRRVILRAGVNTGDRMVILETDAQEAPELEVDIPVSVVLHRPKKPPFPLAGLPFIREKVGERTFRISSGSFFQVNTWGAEMLVRLVREFLAPRGYETLLDLYSGVGLFGLSLAPDVGLVIGIDASESAMEDAAYNAQAFGLENVALHEGPVEEVLKVLWEPAELAVLDPPRSGAGREVFRHLRRLRVRRLVYVSCDPATLARDVQYLQEFGYQLRVVQPVDMFPQTYHVESVSLWEYGE